MSEFSWSKFITHHCHIDNKDRDTGIGCVMIIGRYLMVKIGLMANFTRNVFVCNWYLGCIVWPNYEVVGFLPWSGTSKKLDYVAIIMWPFNPYQSLSVHSCLTSKVPTRRSDPHPILCTRSIPHQHTQHHPGVIPPPGNFRVSCYLYASRTFSPICMLLPPNPAPASVLTPLRRLL